MVCMLKSGRATAEFVVKRKDGQDLDDATGKSTKQITFKIVMDGYSSPISGGNFAVNILNGDYDGLTIAADRTAVAVGAGLNSSKTIPLEILPAGDFDPLYQTPLDVQSGERPVLPLSIDGAVSMAKARDIDYGMAGDEFFIYKFNRSQAGLAGMAFDEGNFGVFGYVVDGLDSVARLQTGDVIVSARLVDGVDRLKKPLQE